MGLLKQFGIVLVVAVMIVGVAIYRGDIPVVSGVVVLTFAVLYAFVVRPRLRGGDARRSSGVD